MSNIIKFPKRRLLNENEVIVPKEMLENIKEDISMDEVVVVGWTEDKKLFISSSHGKTADILFLLDLARAMLLNRSVGNEEDIDFTPDM